MSDRMVSERDAALREREAFFRGAYLYSAKYDGTMSEMRTRLTERAAREYPLPLRTRPRVVRDPHEGFDWMVSNGQLMSRSHSALVGVPVWGYKRMVLPTPERCAVWADLLANPTEEVEDDADAK